MRREIVEILQRRDGISQLEAENLVEETQQEISDAIVAGASLEAVEDILADNLGLEPDYLMCFLM